MSDPRLRRELTTTVLLGALFFGIYGLTQQRVPLNDAYQFMIKIERGDLLYNHLLYLPAAWLFKHAVSSVYLLSPLQTLTLFSAFCGGIAVAASHRIALRFFMNNVQAAGVSLAYGFTAGMWFHGTTSGIYSFHAACTSMSLLALLACLQTPSLSILQILLCGAGIALAPASHLSGAAVALPVVATAWLVFQQKRVEWKRAYAAMALGGAIFLGAYEYSRSSNINVAGYQSSIVGNYYMDRLANPSKIPSYLWNSMKELFLYSAPASPLLPAGFAALFVANRPFALIAAAWFAGYLGICSLIGDRYFGSYYLATFIFQCCIGWTGLQALIVRRGMTGAVLGLLCAAPTAAEVFHDGTGLPVFFILSTIVFIAWRSGRGVATPSPALFVLPGLAMGVFLAGTVVQDVILKPPDWIRYGPPELEVNGKAVTDGTSKNDNYLVVESEPVIAGFWNHIFNMERPERSFCIIFLDNVSPEFAVLYGGEARNLIAERLRRGETIWVIGDLQQKGLGPRATAFWREIQQEYHIDPATAPAGAHSSLIMHRLRLRT